MRWGQPLSRRGEASEAHRFRHVGQNLSNVTRQQTSSDAPGCQHRGGHRPKLSCRRGSPSLARVPSRRRQLRSRWTQPRLPEEHERSRINANRRCLAYLLGFRQPAIKARILYFWFSWEFLVMFPFLFFSPRPSAPLSRRERSGQSPGGPHVLQDAACM